ncbi:MAG TPA: hypothetical protein VM074_12835 [Solimonas sp.]|nr:hypothetical protein [Solimonas sp.]
MSQHRLWKSLTAAGLSLALLALPACSAKKGVRACTDEDAKANALEYVRRDLFKFFPAQAGTMEGRMLALESVLLQSTDETKGESTCIGNLTYRVGEQNLSAQVGYAWAPGGREGDEYSARIWPAGAPPAP